MGRTGEFAEKEFWRRHKRAVEPIASAHGTRRTLANLVETRDVGTHTRWRVCRDEISLLFGAQRVIEARGVKRVFLRLAANTPPNLLKDVNTANTPSHCVNPRGWIMKKL